MAAEEGLAPCDQLRACRERPHAADALAMGTAQPIGRGIARQGAGRRPQDERPPGLTAIGDERAQGHDERRARHERADDHDPLDERGKEGHQAGPVVVVRDESRRGRENRWSAYAVQRWRIGRKCVRGLLAANERPGNKVATARPSGDAGGQGLAVEGEAFEGCDMRRSRRHMGARARARSPRSRWRR